MTAHSAIASRGRAPRVITRAPSHSVDGGECNQEGVGIDAARNRGLHWDQAHACRARELRQPTSPQHLAGQKPSRPGGQEKEPDAPDSYGVQAIECVTRVRRPVSEVRV